MRKIVLSVLLVCMAVAAYCQSPRLIKREYYFDTDPGPGNGTVTLFTACDSIAESILSIPTTGLAVGSHVLYIRYADSAGVWGISQSVSFGVTGTMPETQAQKIVAREYFIDTDPGAGNGTSASFAASDSVSESILSIPTSGLAGGPHALYIRYRDSLGKWGQSQPVYFSVTGMATPVESQSARLVEGEYFIDTDPGAGNGTAITYAAADSLADSIASIPTTGLSAGQHLLYIRYADSAGRWSQPQAAGFAVTGYAGFPESNAPRLYKREYFIDADPGAGNGTVATFAYADSVADTIAGIATTGLVSGLHTLYIRYADSLGNWGTVQGVTFTVTGSVVAGEIQAPRLRRREYFIDTDPGLGNGIGSLVPFTDSATDTISAISTVGLTTGGHLLYIRYADSMGKWGLAQSVGFAVSGTIAENTSPKIRKREYFVDTDPGPGNGSVTTISYSDSLSDAVSIATGGLPLGAHIAYVRYADSTGIWGGLQSFPFTVSSAPQLPPSAPLAKREYFFDADPGLGNGVVSSIAIADSVTETISIPTTGVSNGYHLLYIRYADTAGHWGQLQRIPINIAVISSSSEPQSPPLLRREYFIDTDPGAGNGVVSTFVYTDSIDETISPIPTTGLTQGQHMLFVRYQDSLGVWGQCQSVAFAISGTAGIPETPSPRLARKEYFIDTDPGQGNGIGSSVAYSDSVMETISSISTTGLSVGTHFLFIRYADSAGQWGNVQSVAFTITGVVAAAPERQSAPLNKREYFIDTDPGLGNGVVSAFAAADSVADTILFIPTVGLSSGGHILYMRYADTNGIWGPVQSVIFTVNSALTVTERQSPRLYKREYYIDTDPGPGNGIVSTFGYADSVADTTLIVSTAGLDSGAHVIYIRYADSTGMWGISQYVRFRVFGTIPPEVQAPRIVKREYYIDTDPGPGNGVVSSFAAADSLVDTVVSISTTGLSIGSHLLYMRYADSTGKWGLSQSVLFNVINATASAEMQAPRLRKREYFIDNDPGPGNGIVASIAYSDSVSETIFSIPTDTLSIGAHVLYIRYADSAGKWGIAQSAVFNVVSTSVNTERQSPKLIAGEYYIDTDPGPGAGTPLPAFAMADSAVTDLTIPTTGLATGYHRAYIRYKDSTGRWGLPMSLPIDVCLPPIGLSPISSAAGMCQGSTITVSDTATGGTWSSSNTAVATINAAGIVTGLTAGTTVLTYTKTNACGAAIVTHNLTVSNSLVTATTPTPTVCAGTSAAINATGAAYYSWSPSTGLNSTTAASVAATPTVTTIYTVTGTDIYGCVSSTARQITVNPIPVLTVSPTTASICLGSSRTLSVSGGVSYSWSPAVTFNNTAGSSVTVSPSASTVYTVTGQNAAGCTSSSTFVANVISVPVVPALTGDTIRCAGSTGILTDTASGGVWSSSAPGIATVDGSGNWSAVSAGSATISYNKTNSCFSTTVSRSVTVNAVPSVTISGTLGVCAGSSATINAGGALSYSWLPATGLSATTGAGVTASPAATTAYTVTGFAGNGCSNTAIANLVVNPLPIVTVAAATTSVCAGAATTLSASGASTYSWTPGTGLSASTGALVTSAPAANTTYTVTGISAAGCTGITSVALSVVNAPVVAAITGDTTLCAGSAGTLTDTTSGGVWSSSAPGIATVDGSGTWSAVSTGNAAISYTLSNACFSVSRVRPVRVNYNPAFTVASVMAPCLGYPGNINLATADTSILDYTVDGGAVNHVTINGPIYTLGLGSIGTMHSYVLLNVHTAYCSTTYNDTIVVNPPIMAWAGGAPGHTTDWNYGANWTCGFAPSVTDDIAIAPSVYMPVISNDSVGNVRNLTVSAGCGIQAGSNAMLKVSGNLSNSGVVSGAGKVVLLGSSLQHISGRGTISNLEVKNIAGASVDTGAKLNISIALYLTSGTLATNDSLELLSADTATAARIAPIAPGAGVTGRVIADQYVQSGYRRYRFWSHPFSDTISLGQLQQYIDITGSGGAANGFTTTASNASSSFWFDPYVGNSAASYDPGWRAFTRINAAAADSNRFHPGQGIRLFFRGAKGEGLGYLGYYGMYTPSAATVKMKGNVNQGNVTIALKQGSSAATQSFNMVGNPYPSAVNIGNVLTNASLAGQIIGPAFYVWNPSIGAGGQYMAIPFGGNYNIQASAAFQVMADHDGAVLNFHENDKVAHADVNLFRQAAEITTIGVYDSAGNMWDKLDIHVSDRGSEGYDRQLDAIKPLSTDFSLYSISSDGHKLTIDDRPLGNNAVIPLGVYSSYSQQFRLRADNVAVPDGAELLLHDKLLSRYVPFNANAEYSFAINADKKSQGNERFELMLMRKLNDKTVVALNVWPNPVADELTLTIRQGNNNAAASITVRDMNGVSVYEQDIAPGIYTTVKVPTDKLAAGIYVVEAKCGDDRVVKKIVKE